MRTNFGNILWWTIFTLLGIWLQSLLPGVDILIVGLLVSLQEERFTQTLWLLLVWMLIQEGASGLAFGSGILWYALLFVFYGIGRWLFQVRNIFFIGLLGALLGIWHYCLVSMMAALQDYRVASDRLFVESALQAALFPLLWFVVYTIRMMRPVDAPDL